MSTCIRVSKSSAHNYLTGESRHGGERPQASGLHFINILELSRRKSRARRPHVYRRPGSTEEDHALFSCSRANPNTQSCRMCTLIGESYIGFTTHLPSRASDTLPFYVVVHADSVYNLCRARVSTILESTPSGKTERDGLTIC